MCSWYSGWLPSRMLFSKSSSSASLLLFVGQVEIPGWYKDFRGVPKGDLPLAFVFSVDFGSMAVWRFFSFSSDAGTRSECVDPLCGAGRRCLGCSQCRDRRWDRGSRGCRRLLGRALARRDWFGCVGFLLLGILLNRIGRIGCVLCCLRIHGLWTSGHPAGGAFRRRNFLCGGGRVVSWVLAIVVGCHSGMSRSAASASCYSGRRGESLWLPVRGRVGWLHWRRCRRGLDLRHEGSIDNEDRV